MNRRTALKNAAFASGGFVLGPVSKLESLPKSKQQLKGNFKHSVSRWCFNSVEFEDLCQAVQSFGMHSIELTGPKEWEIMKAYGLTCAIGWDTYPKGISLNNFLSNPDNHDAIYEYYKTLLPIAVEYGVKNLICLSGQKQGRSDLQNLINCQKILKRVMPMAEEHGVTISLEYLNSKVDHPDHQFDNILWGVTLCEMVDSVHFKLLYDIYHAQIMEGDVVATIRKYHPFISHYHTAGVPGRHEINDTQELNYRYIMEEIKKTGYRDFIGQEFVPSGETNEEKLAALKEAVLICDV